MDNFSSTESNFLENTATLGGEEFVQKFNQDPIFAFDTLVKCFDESFTPTTAEKNLNLKVDFSEKSESMDEEFTRNAVTQKVNYIKDKIDRIISGYSVEVTQKTGISMKNSSLKNIVFEDLSPEVRSLFDRYESKEFFKSQNIDLVFPIFSHNFDYLNRILFLVGQKLENFGLSFLELSHLAEEIELKKSNKKQSSEEKADSNSNLPDISPEKAPELNIKFEENKELEVNTEAVKLEESKDWGFTKTGRSLQKEIHNSVSQFSEELSKEDENGKMTQRSSQSERIRIKDEAMDTHTTKELKKYSSDKKYADYSEQELPVNISKNEIIFDLTKDEVSDTSHLMKTDNSDITNITSKAPRTS